MNTNFINENKPDKFLEIVKENFEEYIENKVSEAESVNFISTVLKAAKRTEHNSKILLWHMEDISEMPGDARVMYIYEPTYMITGIIVHALTKYNGVKKIPGLMDQLGKIFAGCMDRDFMGHGYEDLEGLIFAMEIFAKANIKEFLKKYGSDYPEFASFFQSRKEILKELADGNMKGAWGQDYSKWARVVMNCFKKRGYIIVAK